MCYSEAGSSASGQVLPTREYDLPVFGGKVRAFAWGKPLDWNHMFSKKKLDQLAIIAQTAKKYGVTKVFMPLAYENPKLHGEAVVRERVVGTVMDADPDLFRESLEIDGVTFYFGADADGVRLTEPGTAYLLPSADCPAIVIQLPNGTVVACHGGRDSLIEPAKVRAIGHTSYMSVIYSALQGWYNRADNVRVAMILGIQELSFPHPRNHPTYGEVNKERDEHVYDKWGLRSTLGFLSLEAVVVHQLLDLGAPVDEVHFWADPTDTATEMVGDDSVWHSCHLGDATRNCVLIVRLP